jgi:hypothetical protein
MPLPSAHRATLAVLAHRLPVDQVAWAVTGSAGLALQGIDVAVNDLDIQADANDWRRIQAAFSGYVTTPVTWSQADTIRSIYGRLETEGVIVEIVGAPEQLLADGTWTPPADPLRHRLIVDADGIKVPVLDLEWEEHSYRLLGRSDKADLIAEARAQH